MTATGYATTEPLPEHIETTIAAIADMHARHRSSATASQRAFAIMGQLVGRPRFIGTLTLVVGLWVSGNLAALRLGFIAWDPPPFSWLQGVASITALYTTAIILISQKHDDELAALREQLTLELAMLSEQKTAKTIELLESLRRDLPSVPDRHDPEAAEMARPADPQSVAAAISEMQSGAGAGTSDEEGRGIAHS